VVCQTIEDKTKSEVLLSGYYPLLQIPIRLLSAKDRLTLRVVVVKEKILYFVVFIYNYNITNML